MLLCLIVICMYVQNFRVILKRMLQNYSKIFKIYILVVINGHEQMNIQMLLRRRPVSEGLKLKWYGVQSIEIWVIILNYWSLYRCLSLRGAINQRSIEELSPPWAKGSQTWTRSMSPVEVVFRSHRFDYSQYCHNYGIWWWVQTSLWYMMVSVDITWYKMLSVGIATVWIQFSSSVVNLLYSKIVLGW